MRCEEFHHRLNALCDRRQSPGRDVSLQEHGRACADCGEVLDLHETLWTGYYAGAAPPLDDDFAQKVVQRVTAPGRPFRARPHGKTFAKTGRTSSPFNPPPPNLAMPSSIKHSSATANRSAIVFTAASLLVVCLVLSGTSMIPSLLRRHQSIADSRAIGHKSSQSVSRKRSRNGLLSMASRGAKSPSKETAPAKNESINRPFKQSSLSLSQPLSPRISLQTSRRPSLSFLNWLTKAPDVKTVVYYLGARLTVWLSDPLESPDRVTGLKPLARSVSITWELLQKALPRDSESHPPHQPSRLPNQRRNTPPSRAPNNQPATPIRL